MKRLLLIAALLFSCSTPEEPKEERKTLAQAAYEARLFSMCFARADRPGRLYKWSVEANDFGWQVCDIAKRKFTSEGNPTPQSEAPWDESEMVWKILRCSRCEEMYP